MHAGREGVADEMLEELGEGVKQLLQRKMDDLYRLSVDLLVQNVEYPFPSIATGLLLQIPASIEFHVSSFVRALPTFQLFLHHSKACHSIEHAYMKHCCRKVPSPPRLCCLLAAVIRKKVQEPQDRHHQKQPEETLLVEHIAHERGTIQRQESMWCDTEPFHTVCHCQAPCQGTGQETYRESQCSRQKPSETEPGRGKKPSMNCTVLATECRLQPRSRHESPRTRSPDFLVDATLSSSIFPFPMVGCQCSSCVSFFTNYKLTSRRNGHDKEIKPLLHFQRQKLPINVNDYVIVNGNKSGTARYVGHLDSSGMANAVFIGVELDEPSGKHDGVFEGKRYFQCYENFAIFVPVHEIFYVINRKPKKSISPPAPRSVQHRCSLGSLTSLISNAGGRSEHSHPARKKKQHSPKDLNSTRRMLRRSAASTSSRALDATANPSREEWNDGNERTEKAPVSPLQPKTNSRGLTITASLPPDFSHYRPVHTPNRTSPRKAVRR